MRPFMQQRVIQNTPYGEYVAVSGAMGDAIDPRVRPNGYPGMSMAVRTNPGGTIVPTNGFGTGAYARRPMSSSARSIVHGQLQGRQSFMMPLTTGRRRGGMRGFGDSTGLPTSLPGLQLVFEMRNNLWVVASSSALAVTPVLAQMSYTKWSDSPDGQVGTVALFAGTPSPSAAEVVQQQVAAGYAALVEKGSIASGTPRIEFTNSAAEIARAAGGANASWALISDQPAPLIAQASAAATPLVAPAMPTVPPPGQVIPTPQPGSAAPPAQSASLMTTLTTKPTAYYVAGALAVVSIGGLYLATRKKG